MALNSDHKKICDAFKKYEEEMSKTQEGNKAAGRRARGALMDIIKTAKEQRKNISAKVGGGKRTKKGGHGGDATDVDED